jgi:hypothetical protein
VALGFFLQSLFESLARPFTTFGHHFGFELPQ